MVIKKEEREDVFARFHHLDQAVPDNEEKLERKVEKASLMHGNVNRNRRRATNMFDKGVFAEFKINELVEQQAEMKAKQKQEIVHRQVASAKAKATATEQHHPVIGKLAGLVTAVVTNPLKANVNGPNKYDANHDSDSDSENSIHATQSNKYHHRHHNHNHHRTDQGHTKGSVEIKGIDIVDNNSSGRRSIRDIFKSRNGTNSHSSVRTAPTGTVTLSTHKENEEGRIDNHHRRVVALGNDDFQGDGDSFRSSYNNQNQSDDNNGDSDEDNDDDEDEDDEDDNSYIGNDLTQTSKKKHDSVITRSSTGMPIGGMELRIKSKNKDKNKNKSRNHIPKAEESYHWVSPHAADLVFSDFNLDAIVGDYEKLHRKISFGTSDKDNELDGKYGDDNDDDDDDDDDEHNKNGILKITVRYRKINQLWVKKFPRAHGIIVHVLLPLVMIVLLNMVLGIVLGKLEMEYEIENNNDIMRTKNKLAQYPYDDKQHRMFALPTLCLEYFSQEVNGLAYIDENDKNGDGIIDFNEIDIMFQNYNLTALGEDTEKEGNGNDNDSDIVSISKEFIGYDLDNKQNDSMPMTLGEIKSVLKICEDAGKKILVELMERTRLETTAEVISGMTFNWMRCWNITLLGDVNPWFPNTEHLVAATNQSQFFEASWNENQTKLFNQYKDEENCSNATCEKVIHDRSVREATGATMCGINKGASAWFWFVVMTTVGYGNQSPETRNGRLLVGCLGWICIIVWAIILYVGGRVLGIVIDDAFRRRNCRVMTGDGLSATVWCVVSALWIVVVGEIYRFWLDYTTNPEGFQLNVFEIYNATDSEQLSLFPTGDAYWFSYISLLTVGLGDFYLDSESFFYRDLLLWSFCFLVGFTLLSTFLGQLTDLIHNLLPDQGRTLKARLTNTKVVRVKDMQFKRQNEEGIEKLEKLVEVMDDDDLRFITQRLTRIRVKKNLLVHLLHQSQMEMEYYKKRGERYENLSYAKVCQEENMLNEVLFDTVKEREKLETYRRTEVSSTPPPGSARQKSYFQDGTSVEDLEQKLSLRKGKKSVKTRMKASAYL